jgi:heme exporter protein C
MTSLLRIGLPIVALTLLGIGGFLGLVWAPPEAMMGDVYRIIYVHVPSAWMALVAFTTCFVASLVYLLKGSFAADALAEAAAEVGVLFATLLLITGSLWGRPTWGVYWTWDPRLTTAAIMWLAFTGYLALRRFVDVPEKRATWASVVAIIIFVDIPIVWFSVKWWNSLHQLQSSPKTVDSPMVLALRMNAFAFLAVLVWFTRLRYGIARRRQQRELLPPPALADNAPLAEGAVR